MTASLIAPPETALAWELAALAAFDGMIRQIQADQYRRIQRARELAAEVEGVGEWSTSRERDLATRSFVAELATTLGQHEASASRLVAEAQRLTGQRRATLDALEAGDLGLTQVRSVLELTQSLPADIADAVEQVALDVAAAAVADGMVSTNGEVSRRMRRVRERLQPEPLSDRRAQAAEERRVCVDPAADGMAWLSLFIEADRALAIERRLGALATRATPGPEDLRTVTQRAADVAADLLLGGCLDGESIDVSAHVNVTVPVMTLLGLSDDPAELEGYGPIDADTARRLAAHAPSMRRILVHPESGAVLSYGRDTYRAPADLDGFVRVRDGQCRFPGCSRRADRADLDHTLAWQHGGRTDASNLGALCRHHHRLKHETGWRVQQEPGGVMRWTSPAGHLLRTLPERPFEAVKVGEGVAVGPPGSSEPLGPADPPDPIDPLAEELERVIEEDQRRYRVDAPF
ncbi:DUF222 domain-containing protein [Agromyces sp. MMS24-K17]|uniref:HNH endonuclease signature motif containing protein n=1 Tax=Agromyces sp. MMS24-K17 TaxID=3372850 RepID=UPI0037544E83